MAVDLMPAAETMRRAVSQMRLDADLAGVGVAQFLHATADLLASEVAWAEEHDYPESAACLRIARAYLDGAL